MKATRRLFDEDSRLTEFTARVVSCQTDGRTWRIALDQTAFFPEEGGQTCDRGWLAGQQVLHVSEQDHVIWHRLAQPLSEGEEVSGSIDWEKRFWDMQQHTGEHIVSGLVHSLHGYDNVGFHLGSEYVTMDYNGVLTREQLREIEWKANQAVADDLPVGISWPAPDELAKMPYRSKKEIEGDIRIVEIPGIDLCACCAPHVQRTGQIGMIKLTGMESYKGGVRVYMLCGFRALADYRQKEESSGAISALLSAKSDEIFPAVKRQKEECDQLRFEVNRLRMELIQSAIRQLPEAENACLFDPNLDKGNSRRAWNLLCQRFPGLCGVFAGSEQQGWQFILGGGKGSAREAGQALITAFSGKGGGSPQMFQGQISGNRKEIEFFFENGLTNKEI